MTIEREREILFKMRLDLLNMANYLKIVPEDTKAYNALVSFVKEVMCSKVEASERFLPTRFADMLIFHRAHGQDLESVLDKACRDMDDFFTKAEKHQ